MIKFFTSKIALRLLDAACVLLPAVMLASILGIPFFISGNLPTGGDAASHLLYAWLFAHELLPNGQITAWLPEVFAGFAFLSYYFPLPFISIAALSALMPFAMAMKWGMFAAAFLLPGAVWLSGVYLLKLSRWVAVWGIPASLAVLLHEQHSIWGGNLLSTLAGEFAYSYGILFALVTLCAWQRTIATGKHVWLVVVLEAATGFSHGFALLATGFATTAYLFERGGFVRNLRLLLLGHGMAFMLLGGWLWPMLQMHGITIPNDAFFEVQNWRDLLPETVQPVLAAGVLSVLALALLHGIPALRRQFPALPEQANALRHAAFMGCTALLAGTFYLTGSQLGLANIRFFPLVWLFGGVACAWVWGTVLLRIARNVNRIAQRGILLLAGSAACALAAWLALHVHMAPDWGLWNHSGLESKPQWQQLSKLFPAMAGDLQSPRLVFEHDPANSDIGSTRALEALPMFLNSRPVLEGLYMESALVSPAIYQLQSEVSARPSSPLARFPSGSLDVEMAAKHMRWLYSNEVLLRSSKAQQAFAASPQFTEAAQQAPFYLYRLKDFRSQLVDIPTSALKQYPKKGWMEESFRWFRSKQRLDSELPIFTDTPLPPIAAAKAGAAVQNIVMDRSSIRWKTNAPGVAHLVRVAWHPRWQLQGKGQLYVAGPGFMLVVPEQEEVVLVYGHTTIGKLGMLATGVTALLVAFLAWRGFAGRSIQTDSAAYPPWPASWPALLWPLALLLVGVAFHHYNPERVYGAAWIDMRASQYLAAADTFDQAYTGRKSDSKKEEALFWAAKANELGGRKAEALARYRQLTALYHGYWLPESLYLQGALAQAEGLQEEARTAHNRLLNDYPNDRWAQRVLQDNKP